MCHRFAILLVAGAVSAAVAADAKKETVPGQRTAILIDGKFRFVPGAWARYDVLDNVKQERYELTFAILDTKKQKGKPYRWMEIDARLEKQPRVVTRLLVQETPDGPGEMADVIVQVHGMTAFRVPKKFYQNQKDAAVAPAAEAFVRKEVERRTLQVAGRQLAAILVEAEDRKGKVIRAVVSEECAPIGVVSAESDEIRMMLTDFGLGAKTGIEGPVLNFYLWLMEQMLGAGGSGGGGK
ncbi:MAG: hypothetical protein HY821_06975 [Acidobacteria bacterium]|nr:hypothetical protein [Acidobacteriota bacterium]